MSMSLRGKQCPVCEEWYADWATRCPVCGVALVHADAPLGDDADGDGDDVEVDPTAFALDDGTAARPDRPDDFDVLALPEDEQLVYELAEWSLTMRADVAAALADAGVPHAWERTDLIVHLDDEAEVDRICEAIEADHGVTSSTTRGRDDVPSTEPHRPSDARELDASEPDDDESDESDDESEADSLEVALGTDDLLEYDLAPWAAGLRRALFQRLDLGGIAYRRDGETLVVRTDDEALVEAAIDAVSDPDVVSEADLEADLEDASDEPDEDASYAAMSNLFLAADRLRRDADDREGTRLVAEAIDTLDPDEPPFGVSPTAWQQVVVAAEALADSVAAEPADDDAVSTRAQELRAILRPLV